jgi:predicted amidohydrolase YtcJ
MTFVTVCSISFIVYSAIIGVKISDYGFFLLLTVVTNSIVLKHWNRDDPPCEGRRFLQPDLILKNANIWTVDDLQPRAQAVAICGNEIMATGTDSEIEALATKSTRIIDLKGKLVLPGFNDCHTHFVGASLRTAMNFDLYGATTIAEVQQRLSRHSHLHPAMEWLRGMRWFPTRINNGQWPTRHELDAVEAARPVAIFDIDGHSCWVNTPALHFLGYDASTPDPIGGEILRESDGFPTGVLFENAYNGIERVGEVSVEDFEQIFPKAVARLNQLGLTSLSNNRIDPSHLDACEKMANEGLLTMRISEWPALQDDLSPALALRTRFAANEKIRMTTLKVFIDGVMSNYSAWMLEPYADNPATCGYPVTRPEDLERMILNADGEGFQVATHAIGDRAVRTMLDIYEKARRVNGKRDARHRLEHIESSHPADRPRFAELGVIASMTPVHCTADLQGYSISRLGANGDHGFAWHSFLDLGIHLAFGTDWPAIDLKEPNPLEQIFGAVTRQTPEEYRAGKPVWHPEQRLTAAQAVRSYTLEPAYAEFMEQRKGSITPGKLADLIVLSDNILEDEPGQILETRVLMTIFDGKIVHDTLSEGTAEPLTQPF